MICFWLCCVSLCLKAHPKESGWFWVWPISRKPTVPTMSFAKNTSHAMAVQYRKVDTDHRLETVSSIWMVTMAFSEGFIHNLLGYLEAASSAQHGRAKPRLLNLGAKENFSVRCIWVLRGGLIGSNRGFSLRVVKGLGASEAFLNLVYPLALFLVSVPWESLVNPKPPTSVLNPTNPL